MSEVTMLVCDFNFHHANILLASSPRPVKWEIYPERRWEKIPGDKKGRMCLIPPLHACDYCKDAILKVLQALGIFHSVWEKGDEHMGYRELPSTSFGRICVEFSGPVA